MKDRTRVQGRCPTCGPMTLLPRDFTCAVPADPGAAGLAEFHCPSCGTSVFSRVTPQEAKLLVLLGGREPHGAVPLELTEDKSGPPVTIDDLFDLHVALEAICCPQDELIGGAGDPACELLRLVAFVNAFVLSGGANLGSVQAGMLTGLLESGIRPDFLVGTSIGAANAAFLAGDPTLERARELGRIWRAVRPKDVFPIHPLRAVRSIARGGALFSPEPLWGLVEDGLGYRRVEDSSVPLRIVATRFSDGSEVVFEKGSVRDAILASTALPLVYPPHDIGGELYLDGGLSDQVPLEPAVSAGADRIYVLSVGFPCPAPLNRSPRSLLMHSVGILLSQRIRRHFAESVIRPGVQIIQIPPVCTEVGLRDFSKTSVLIDEAHEQTVRFLNGDECTSCHHKHAQPEKGETHVRTAVSSL